MTETAREANCRRAREWREKPENQGREAATKAAYKAANPELWQAQRSAASLRYSEKNRQAIRDRANATRVRLRAQVIEAYGGRCSCPGCHVHHAELLTVDHVKGGAHHRTTRKSTREIYRAIVKAGFPADFQLLCGSCNLAKSDRDKCPLAGEDH
jgi:5-methylcytosine-specific restriction endonuclease McrA